MLLSPCTPAAAEGHKNFPGSKQCNIAANQEATNRTPFPWHTQHPIELWHTRCFLATSFISRIERIPSHMWAVFLILMLKVYESVVFKKKVMELGAGVKCKTNIPYGFDPKTTGLTKSISKTGPPAISRLGLRGVLCTTSECLLHFLPSAWLLCFLLYSVMHKHVFFTTS